ncbi:MAG: RagB/SusD family nutrient uptake outer membrane protein [Bacteroidales bacterium]|nr:RagB/SusD family nutrient uptake outer membrane protein [Bacteroidales bacterium]
MKKIFLLALAALAFASCEMDFYRSDALKAEDLAKDPNAPLYMTNGIYTLFQDRIAYKGQDGGESGNYYVRHYFQLTELRGDNVTVSGITEDPFINPYRYIDDNTAKNIYYTWWMAYKIIDTANRSMDFLENAEQLDSLGNHLMGENLFFRALCHFQMVTLFAQPYAYDKTSLGVPIRLQGSGTSIVPRSTVEEVYEQVVKDLVAAKSFMQSDSTGVFIRGKDKGMVSWQAATALLSRVYLYMGENQKCIDECDKLLANPSAALAGYDYADYPTHTFDHPETIWCIHLKDTHEWAADHGEAAIASMYYKDGIGWGEHYWREDLIDMFRRFPADKRFKAYFRMIDVHNEKTIDPKTNKEKVLTVTAIRNYDQMLAAMGDTLSVVYPVPGGDGDYCTGAVAIACEFNDDGSVNFQSQGEQIGETEDPTGKMIPVFKYYDHVAKRQVIHNGLDTLYYVENSDAHFPGKDIDGVKRVWVRPGPAHAIPGKKTNPDTGEKYAESQADADARFKAAIGRTDNGGFYMRYYNTKFSGQGGKVMMTSPVMLRWGEVVLNRAEAEAKLGQDGKALDDINIIRSRAGIPAMDAALMADLEYPDVLTAVLDERRMELCFEGHRFFDVFRNNLPLDRRYVGYHTWEIIQPGDLRIAMLISQDEINSSGITQNPR